MKRRSFLAGIAAVVLTPVSAIKAAITPKPYTHRWIGPSVPYPHPNKSMWDVPLPGNEWDDPTNWDCGTVPTDGADVLISPGKDRYTRLCLPSEGTAYLKSVTIVTGCIAFRSGPLRMLNFTTTDDDGLFKS